MSTIRGKISGVEIIWNKAPFGNSGTGEASIAGVTYSVRWRPDEDGIWVEFPHGIFGYDISGEPDENDASTLVYRVSERGGDGLAYALRFRGDGEAALADASSGKKKNLRVRAQMPGKIVRVLVKQGDSVFKDQPLLVMEAMKMENEIRALQAGRVESLKVTEGQAVESGADLILIASE